MDNQYNLRKLPSHELIAPHGDKWLRPDRTEVPEALAKSVVKWSGPEAPPAIGTKVVVAINEYGLGTVANYFVEHGFLGVGVRPDVPPAWHVKQNGRNALALVFGSELRDPRRCRYCDEPRKTGPTCGRSECQQADYEATTRNVRPPVGVRGVAHAEKRDRQAKNRRSRYPQSRRVARGER